MKTATIFCLLILPLHAPPIHAQSFFADSVSPAPISSTPFLPSIRAQSLSDSVQEAWVRHYASGRLLSRDVATAIAVDALGNVYVTGSSGDDYATIKYNSAGTPQWVARYPGAATALAIDAAGNVYVTGRSDLDYATIKYNGAGAPQWVARYNGPDNIYDEATALAVDVAGNVYVTGRSQGSSTSDDYATIKYNAAGAEQWAVRYNGPGNSYDEPTALAVDVAENVYVTGTTGSGAFSDYATVKYNSAGAPQWAGKFCGRRNRPCC